MTSKDLSISLLAAATLLCSGAFAQERAAEATNLSLGLDAQDTSTSGSTSAGTLGVSGAVTTPLGSLFGATVAGGYSKTTIRAREMLMGPDGSDPGVRSPCEFDNNDYSLTVFARRPSLGRIAATYGAGRLSSNCGVGSGFLDPGEDTLDIDRYRVDAEFYFGDLTFAAARTSTDLQSGSKLESTELTTRWYVFHNLSVAVSGSELYDHSSYGVRIDHQPEFLGDALGVYLSYARTDSAPHTRTARFGLAYHFGTRVDLKTRDRQYR